MKTLAIVGIIASIAVYSLGGQREGQRLNQEMDVDEREFVKYVAQYGKSYGTKEEYYFRANLFKKAREFVRTENAKTENTFTVAINQFADRTSAEMLKKMGYKKFTGVKEVAPYVLEPAVSIPTSVDWRNEGAVNPIRDQGDCGACWAFAALGAIESGYKIKYGGLYSLSVQQLVDCCHYGGSFGCAGGF